MLHCWNCHGIGLVPFIDEDEPERETFVYGDECPICHGQAWLLVKAQNIINHLKRWGQSQVAFYIKEFLSIVFLGGFITAVLLACIGIYINRP
jgi:hypothetical protein